MFDGFDEICPDYEDIVKDLFTKLKTQTNIKIWVTSRENYKEKLENIFDTFAYSLQEFSKDDQTEFLEKFWKANLLLQKTKENKIKSCAVDAINKLKTAISDKYNSFLGIPLQLKMIGEILETDINDFELSTKINDLFSLYTTFFDKKLNKYFLEDKKKINSSAASMTTKKQEDFQRYFNIFQIFAMQLIIREKSLIFPTNEEKNGVETWQEDIKSIGIIDDFVKFGDDKIAHFVHFTYAEYFAACYLSDKYEKDPDNILKIINEILDGDVPVFKYCIVHLFITKHNAILESFLKGKSVANDAANKGFTTTFQAFLFHYEFLLSRQTNKSILHLAVKNNNINIVVDILVYYFNLFTDHKYNLTSSQYVAIDGFEKATHFLSHFINGSVDQKDLCCKNGDEMNTFLKQIKLASDRHLSKKCHTKLAINDILSPLFTQNLKTNSNALEIYIEFLCNFCIETLPIVFKRLESLLTQSFLPYDQFFKSLLFAILNSEIEDDKKIELTEFLVNTIQRLKLKFDDKSHWEALIFDVTNGENYFKKIFINEYLSDITTNIKYLYKFLSTALEYSNHPITEFLVNHYVKKMINIFENGEKLIHLAVEMDTSLKIINWICISSQEDLKIQSNDGTPLLISAKNKLIPIKVKFLIEKYAEAANITDNNNKIPLDYALENNDKVAIELLLKYTTTNLMPRTKTMLKFYNKSYDNDPEIICLYEAIKIEDKELCKFLLEKGADPNKVNESGETPLQLACNSVKLVTMLLEYGANFQQLQKKIISNEEVSSMLKEIHDIFNDLKNISKIPYDRCFPV